MKAVAAAGGTRKGGRLTTGESVGGNNAFSSSNSAGLNMSGTSGRPQSASLGGAGPHSSSAATFEALGGFGSSAAFGSTLNTNNTTGVADETALMAKITQLERDLERRQKSYITRERAYKVRIDELEEELSSHKAAKTGWMAADGRMADLKAKHSQILNNVTLVQERTAKILQEQERDLLRAFRARLFDVQSELEKEKSRKDDGAAAWIERTGQLQAEVEWTKEVADRLERVNQALQLENARLKSENRSKEDHMSLITKQLSTVKRDNTNVRSEYLALEAEYKALQEKMKATSLEANDMSSQIASKNLNTRTDADEKCKELNVRLRRLLAEERKSLQQLRQNYAAELKTRTEMETLLRHCVEDVRKEIAQRYVQTGQLTAANGTGSHPASTTAGVDLATLYTKNPSLIPVDDFTQADRERVLELLLSQERVVSLIYAKSFPIANGGGRPSSAGGAAFDTGGLRHDTSAALLSELANADVGDHLVGSPNPNAYVDRPMTTGGLNSGNPKHNTTNPMSSTNPILPPLGIPNR